MILKGAWLFAAALLAGAPLASGAETAKPMAPPLAQRLDPKLVKWRVSIRRLRPKQGCSTAEYPKLKWRKVACTTAPDILFSYHPTYTATVTNLLQSADGVFTTSDITSETGLYKGVDTADAYSVQLNSSPFSTAACQGGSTSCKGWQQYIYASHAGKIFVQYWLLHYGPSCPAGWTQSDDSCVMNSQAANVPMISANQMNGMEMYAQAGQAPSSDFMLFFAGGRSYTTPDLGSVLGLSKAWNTIEFNVYGEGDRGTANFNSGAKIWVNIKVGNGMPNVPGCVLQSFTAERNNLILSYTPPEVMSTGPYGAISFMESNPAGEQGQKCFTASGLAMDAAAGHR